MRASPLLALVFLTACPDPEEGGPDGGGGDGGGGDGGAVGDGGSGGDGGEGEGATWTHALSECADGSDVDTMVCYTFAFEPDGVSLRRLDLGPGSSVDVATSAALSTAVDRTLYVDGDAAWLCADDLLTRWDLATGVLEVGPEGCDAVALHPEGFLVRDGYDTVLYPSPEDALAGVGGVEGQMHEEASTWASATWGDLGITSWHSTDELELFHWSTGKWNRTVDLEVWDTWVEGIAATGGSVMLVDDGRGGDTGGRLRLAAHDLVTGELEWERLVGAREDSYTGLHCGCLGEAGEGWTDNDLDGVDGAASGGEDCDDADPQVHPGALESCDGVDQDCDGEVDEDACSLAWSTSADFGTYLSASGDSSIKVARAVSDLTGDGQVDLLAGDSSAEVRGVTSAGRVWLVPGPIDGAVELTEAGTAVLEGRDTYGYLGGALASLGDADGDGHADIAVGARGVSNGAGRVYVVPGPLAAGVAIEDAASLVIAGTARDQYVGYGLARVDGLLAGGDALVVDAARTGEWSGAVHLFPVDASGALDVEDAAATLVASSSNMQPTLARTADLDGDGIRDLLLGEIGQEDQAGAVMLWPGPVTGDASSGDLDTLVGWEARQLYGTAVAVLGDTDGDGYADFAVHSGYAYEHVERVDIYNGPYTSTLGATDAVAFLLGNQVDGRFGDDLSGPGDLDGDGREDLVLGERNYDDSGEGHAGAVHVALGPFAGQVLPHQSWVGAASTEYLGDGLAGQGDLTGDGLPDVLVSAANAFEDANATWFVLGADSI